MLAMWDCRCDLTFSAPKAIVMVDFQSPEAYASPEAAVCTRWVGVEYVSLLHQWSANNLSYHVGPTYSICEATPSCWPVVSAYAAMALVIPFHIMSHIAIYCDFLLIYHNGTP